MKFWVLTLLIIILTEISEVFSQTTEPLIPVGYSTIENVFKQIRKNTNFEFFYRPDQLNVTKEIYYNSESNDINAILSQVLAGLKLKYTITADSLIVIMPIDETKIVRGKVYSEAGEPLQGAYILLNGSGSFAMTDIDGNFSFEVPSEYTNVVVSYIGYLSRKIDLQGQRDLFIVMREDLSVLDPVIIVGYGIQKKSLVTGSISRIAGDDITNTLPTRTEQALQGKTAGVTIMQNSGSPGSPITVRVRGIGSNYNSEPLYIVDDMRVVNIDFIEPSDIESIEVLKDAASSAIYGAEGANGVVYITTKHGKKTESILEYDFNFGWQKVAKPMKMLNAKEYATYKKEAFFYEKTQQAIKANKEPPSLEALNAAYKKTGISDPDSLSDETGTNWLGDLFQTAPMSKHHIAYSGGNEKSNFRTSLTYFSQDGIVGGKGTNFKRYSARMNSEHTLSEWLYTGTKFTYTHVERSLITENQEYGGLVSNAIFIDPITPKYYDNISQIPSDIYNAMLNRLYKGDSMAIVNSTTLKDENGYFGVSDLVRNEIRNPFAQLHNNHNQLNQDRFLGGIYIDLKPFRGFKLRSQPDFDLYYTRNYGWTPRTLWNIDILDATSSVFDNMTRDFTWQWENYATYSNKLWKHAITILVGSTIRSYEQHLLGGAADYMQSESEDFAYISSTLSNTMSRTAYGFTTVPKKLLSYFGRLSYNYGEKYILEGALRRDGSSLFAGNKRFGTFPSISAGWVISREEFWKFDPVNFVKLRFSWGRNGSLENLTAFMYAPRISNIVYGAGGNNGALFSLDAFGNPVAGVQPVALSNPDLTWETSEQTDVGTDIGIFGNKLLLNADYYFKKTKDLLARGGAPGYLGNDPPIINAGNIENSGFEINLEYRDAIGQVRIDVSANAAYLKNKVTYYGSEGGQLNGATVAGEQNITMFKPGYPAWYFNTYETDGIFQSWDEIKNYKVDTVLIQPNAIPGDYKIVDQNGDGVINIEDRKYSGSPWPKWTFGFTSDISYKGFDLDLFICGSIGNKVFNGFHRSDLSSANVPKYYYDDRWTPDNHTDKMCRATYSFGQNYAPLDIYVEDGSWVKLKSLSLGYNIPERILKKLPIKKFRLFISGQNLYTYTKYRGMDPEIGTSSATNQGGLIYSSVGIDKGFYPSARIFLIGINVTF
jgi:TonB-dependent starch-binding outer membrane protein SusC